MTQTPAELSAAREQFLTMVEGIRPELHRYCARLTGSVIEGEDIVQETLAKAFYALSLSPEVPPLRPWLFRIAHNAALDFLKSHGRKYVEVRAELDDVAAFEEKSDPMVVRAALARFVALPVSQRSAVILKDVLDHSLEETAETMGISVMAVKAALVRGRRALLDAQERVAPGPPPAARADLERYASLFNRKDWEGLRALVSDDCRLDLVSRSQRRGKHVAEYFSRYEKQELAMRVCRLEDRLAVAVYALGSSVGAPPPPAPAYFILLGFENGQVCDIRDFRYVPYIADDADFEVFG